MRKEDLKDFCQILDAVCGLLSRGAYAPNAQNAALFFRSLARFDLETVRAAFDAHVCDPVRGKFVPVPADILAQIEGGAREDGRPEVDEAWAMALLARDEGATVVWTEETAEAFGVAQSVLRLGDDVGARMAFKACYLRLLEQARARRAPVKWSASLGHNKAEQRAVLEHHARLGRDVGRTQDLLPSNVGLLELAKSQGATQEAREALLKIKEKLMAVSDEPSAAELERARTRQLKQQSAELVARAGERA